MTEAEWLECKEPTPMLHCVWDRASERKLRLFQVAFCRSIWSCMPSDSCRVAVVLAERYADGEASAAELSAVSAAIAPNLPSADRVAIKAKAAALYGTDPYIRRHPLFFGGASVDTEVADRDDGITTPSENELAFKAAEASEATLLRCLFGNPFRPCTFAEAWRTDTVLSLARTMYDSRDFGAMPILADAIQDAECDNDIILDHCRGPRPHCRGCWVVDLILGKE